MLCLLVHHPFPKVSQSQLATSRSCNLDLLECKDYWERQPLGINYLLNARYISTIAKGNRCKRLLAKNSDDASDSIVGARFEQIPGSMANNPRHIITYCIEPRSLDKTHQGARNLHKRLV